MKETIGIENQYDSMVNAYLLIKQFQNDNTYTNSCQSKQIDDTIDA